MMDSKRRYRYLGVVLVVAGALFLAVCTHKQPLVVGIHPWVGYEPIFLAREMRWLPESIQIRDNSTLAESLAQLQSGEASAACMTLDEMLRARAAGLPLSAALVFDVSAGADAVLARKSIRSLRDLAHKRIAFDPGALGGLVFEKLLEAGGLTASDVIQVNLPPERHLEAWRRNEVDAVITYEPMTTAFLREGAHVLLDSRQIPDTIIDVLAVRRDQQNADLVSLRALAASHFRATEHMRIHAQDFVLRVAAREEVAPEEAQRMLAGVVFPSLSANRTYLSGADARLISAARVLSALMVRRGLLAKQDDLKHLTLADALPREER